MWLSTTECLNAGDEVGIVARRGAWVAIGKVVKKTPSGQVTVTFKGPHGETSERFSNYGRQIGADTWNRDHLITVDDARQRLEDTKVERANRARTRVVYETLGEMRHAAVRIVEFDNPEIRAQWATKLRALADEIEKPL